MLRLFSKRPQCFGEHSPQVLECVEHCKHRKACKKKTHKIIEETVKEML